MNGKKSPLLITLFLYVIAGVAACGVFFVYGTSWAGKKQPAVVPYYIQETIAAVHETETTLAVQETETTLADSATTEAAEPESQTAPDTPEVPETTAEPSSSDQKPEVFYSFRVLDIQDRLHVREGAGGQYKSIAKIKSGTTGFVLEKGPQWSLIQTGDITGYVYNTYVEFIEIPEEEYLPRQ